MANPDLWDGSLLKSDEPKPKKQRAALSRGKGPARTKGIKEKSEKKTFTDKIHDAYRDAFIFLARRYDDMNCWVCGIPCKPSQLDLHHVERRSKGGKHKAHNYLLVCNVKSENGLSNCHDRLDNNDVRWTGRTA